MNYFIFILPALPCAILPNQLLFSVNCPIFELASVVAFFCFVLHSMYRLSAGSYQQIQVFDIPLQRVDIAAYRCWKSFEKVQRTILDAPLWSVIMEIHSGKADHLFHGTRLRDAMRNIFVCLLSEFFPFNWDQKFYTRLERYGKMHWCSLQTAINGKQWSVNKNRLPMRE